ncbi:hypothetical protein Tco_1439534 [Tanacetum coccineum]
MAWFEQLETHLHDLYLLNSPYAVDAFKPAFCSFFGDEHQTFKLKMFHNLDQLRLQLERENLHGVNAKTCSSSTQNSVQGFLASKGVNATDSSESRWMTSENVSKSSGIESENNNALSTSVNGTQLQQHESLVTESTTLEVNLNTDVKALDAGLVITESSRTKGGEIDQDAEHDQVKSPLLKAEFLKTNHMVEKEVYNELSNRFLQLEKHCISLEISIQQKEKVFKVTKTMYAIECCEFFEINDLKAQLQAKTTLICNLKNQIKSVKEASNEAKVKHEIDVLETINIELESSVAKLLAENEKLNKENEHLKQTYKELYDSIKRTRIQTKDHNDSLIAQINSKTVENADLKAHIQEKIFTGHRFSPNKTSAVYEKTSPRSDLRWKPTGRIFKSIGLRWIPTRKLFDSYIRKVDSEPPHGTNVDIPNIHECKQTLDVSAGTSINVQKEQSLDLSAEHPSDTQVFTVKMEILLEPTSNKLLNFVSSNNTSSTNGAVNIAHGSTTASTQATAVNSTTIDNLSDAVICSDQAKDGPTNFALMAYSSTSSNSEVSTDSNCSSSCLENVKILKEQNEQLLKDLRTSKLNAIAYKIGLESVEARLLVYKKNEFVYKEDIKIVDKCKTSLGYNVVPPPYIGNFMPLKLDLSFSGLEEFTCEPIVIKPVVENNKAKVSNNEEDDVPQAKIEKKSIKPSFAKIAFVKPKEKTARKTAKQVE